MIQFWVVLFKKIVVKKSRKFVRIDIVKYQFEFNVNWHLG